jgi:hypothetical protein
MQPPQIAGKNLIHGMPGVRTPLCRINAGEVKFEADENALATR